MGAHVYVHSPRRQEGKVYLIYQPTRNGIHHVDVPVEVIYVLNGKDGNKRATVMTLNGRDLVLGENWELPDLSGDPVSAGKIELAPMTCTFLVV